MKKIIITTLLTACIFTTNANDLDTHVQCITSGSEGSGINIIDTDGSGNSSIGSEGSGINSIGSEGSGINSIGSEGSGINNIGSEGSGIQQFCAIIKI